VLEEDYPYSSSSGTTGTCQYEASMATDVMETNWGWVDYWNVEQMKAALQVQPLAVTIEADK